MKAVGSEYFHTVFILTLFTLVPRTLEKLKDGIFFLFMAPDQGPIAIP
jgi:hypothetical protein